MTFFELVSVIAPFLSIAAIIIFTIAYVWTQGKNGFTKASQDAAGLAGEVIGTYKTRIEQLEKDRDEQKYKFEEERKINQEKINAMSKEIGELRGALQSKDEQIKVLQGRNPETEEVLKKLASAAEASPALNAAAYKYMEDTAKILNEMKNSLAELHSERRKR